LHPLHQIPEKRTRRRTATFTTTITSATHTISKKRKPRSRTKGGEENGIEELLFTISHLLPHDKLSGVVAIVHGSGHCCDDLNSQIGFDINSLDKTTLNKLQEYVNGCLYVQPTRSKKTKTTTLTKITRFTAKQTKNIKNHFVEVITADTTDIFKAEEILTIKSVESEDEEVDVGDCFDS